MDYSHPRLFNALLVADNDLVKRTRSATLYDGFQKIRRALCPFVNLLERTRGRWGLGITPAVMRTCSWVEPVLVAQIKFTEWTSDNQLRQPVFLGLRTDKAAKEVVRE